MSATYSEMGSQPDANEYLKKIADDLAKNPPEDKNGGHNALMQDLSELSYEAYTYEFNDYKNQKYATPKVELRNKLLALAQNVEDGKYDN
jgi:hypothetical protein